MTTYQDDNLVIPRCWFTNILNNASFAILQSHNFALDLAVKEGVKVLSD